MCAAGSKVVCLRISCALVLCISLVDWVETCNLNIGTDGFFDSLTKILVCSPWVAWIALNAAVHFLWVGTLLGCQLYQVQLVLISQFIDSQYTLDGDVNYIIKIVKHSKFGYSSFVI